MRDDNKTIAWMLDGRLEQGLRTLQDNALSFDILVQDWQEIPLATRLAKLWPGLLFVLDHRRMPDIANHVFDPWTRHIDELASLPNVVCKLSGRRCHGVGGLVAEEHDENQLVRISVPTGDHSPGDLALSPVHA